MKNPFSVLGITPEAIRGLPVEKLEALIEGVWKTWSKVYAEVRTSGKPSAKSQERLRAINEAYEKLKFSKGGQGQFWKQEYLKTSRVPKKEIEQQLDQVREVKHTMHLDAVGAFSLAVNDGGRSLNALVKGAKSMILASPHLTHRNDVNFSESGNRDLELSNGEVLSAKIRSAPRYFFTLEVREGRLVKRFWTLVYVDSQEEVQRLRNAVHVWKPSGISYGATCPDDKHAQQKYFIPDLTKEAVEEDLVLLGGLSSGAFSSRSESREQDRISWEIGMPNFIPPQERGFKNSVVYPFKYFLPFLLESRPEFPGVGGYLFGRSPTPGNNNFYVVGRNTGIDSSSVSLSG